MNQVTVKERPILFSSVMVRAILEGRKTQTRRIVKPVTANDSWEKRGSFIPLPTCERTREGHYKTLLRLCPYGQPGDGLWVRETWAKRWLDVFNSDEIAYRADEGYFPATHNKWRPSIHMNRKFSRIDLEVVKVRVERLQDISEEDSQAEGVEPAKVFLKSILKEMRLEPRGPYYGGFQQIWRAINGGGSWELNPWVWAIEFKRVRP